MADEVIKPKTDKTTIPMRKKTRDRVKAFGKKGESWDELENRIMDIVEKSDKSEVKTDIKEVK
jgi:ketosteroid isomerase-like protein